MAKTFKKKIEIIFLVLILFLATFLRLWQLNLVPPELFGDELDVGYHAYSILKTGKDYYGQFLPTYIHSLAEWRAPLLMYATAPSVGIFGLNEWGVRIPPAIFGVLGVLFLYLVVKEIFTEQRIALLAAFLLAICPWHLHYSRAAFEVTLLLTLFLGGILFFLRGLKKPHLLLPSAILLALTPYTYSTANLFLPLLLFSLFLIYKKKVLKLNKKWLGISLLVGLLILLPLVSDLASGRAADRFATISIFSDQGLIDEIVNKRSQEEGGGRLFHNKATAWSKALLTNYLTSFSPQFLFLEGDPNPRHRVGDMGELYLILLPLFLIGIWVGLGKIKEQSFQLIFSWLVLAPIPSALTSGGGNQATRLFLMLPPLIILSSFGLLHLLRVKKKRLKTALLFVVCCLLFVETIFCLHQYSVHYSKETWRWWHYGYKEAMTYIGRNQDQYEQVLINNTYEPSLLRFLFWIKYDPAQFQQKFTIDQPQENILPGFDGFKLEKFYFGTLNEEGSFDKILTPKTLYLVSQKDEVGGDWDWRKEPPSEVKVLKTVTNLFNEPLFYLVTGK